MRQVQLLMGMPITVEVADAWATTAALESVFSYFTSVDEQFSTYKHTSEISRINNGQLELCEASLDMQTIFALSESTRHETYGYFDIVHDGKYDPSGIVKGWAIYNAAKLLSEQGFRNFYVDAGGDIQVSGHNANGQNWRVGIRNPFNIKEIVKILTLSNQGVATSGTYVRGNHIYNPQHPNVFDGEIVSMSVIGPNIYEADRFATAAFAMGRNGILFIESLPGFEGYMIDKNGQATLTSGFEGYTQ
jgi:thiamine biosynthesis lipoprotein